MHRVCHCIAMIACLSVFLISCAPSGRLYHPPPELDSLRGDSAAYPETAFAVIADPHFYDSRLGTDGTAFQAYLDEDRKLLKESGELLDAAVDDISAVDVDFVIVCGDMTQGWRENQS